VKVLNGVAKILDQRKLPTVEEWLPLETIEQAYDYIKTLAVRGAPLIGCVAVLSLAIYSLSGPDGNSIIQKSEYLKSARPTAVNLFYACDIIAQKNSTQPDYSTQNICHLAYQIIYKEIEMNDKMASHGAELINDGDNILTHCNTGSLATIGVGTALGVIKKAHSQGKKIHVYVDETRPLLQGGRLTAYELEKEKIPYTIICDNMAGFLMKQKKLIRYLLEQIE